MQAYSGTGDPQPPPHQPPAIASTTSPTATPTGTEPAISRWAVASFAAAICGYALWSVPLFVDVWSWPSSEHSLGGWGGPLVGLVFIGAFVAGIVGTVRTAGHRRRGRGFAIAGLLLSLPPAVVVLVVGLFLGIAMSGR